MLTKSLIILPLSDQQTPAISPHYWYSQFVKPQLFPLPPPPPGSLYRGMTECFTCTAILAQIPGNSPALFLSLDTESINFDHHLRCCGCTVGTICEGKSTTVTHFYGCPHPTRPCLRIFFLLPKKQMRPLFYFLFDQNTMRHLFFVNFKHKNVDILILTFEKSE